MKEGDEVDIRVADEHRLDVAVNLSREQALERIKALAARLPPDWKFDREEANGR